MFFKGECDTETNMVWKEGPMEMGRVLVNGPATYAWRRKGGVSPGGFRRLSPTVTGFLILQNILSVFKPLDVWFFVGVP